MAEATFGFDAVGVWQPVALGGRRHRFRRALLVVALMIAGVLTGAAGSVLWETVTFAQAMHGRILPGAVVAGMDVGGMTEAEALAAVTARVEAHFDDPVTVELGDRAWTSSARALGATTDAAAAVDRAAHAGRGADWMTFVRVRWFGEEHPFEGEVRARYSAEKIRAFVDGIAVSVNRPALDARMEVRNGWVDLTPEQPGIVMDTEATAAALLDTVIDPKRSVVPVVAHEVPAEEGAAQYGQVLLLRQREHKLYLYQDGEITHSWIVTTGTGRYPTPTGIHEITLKRHMPTWVNPAPNGWGKGMPASIGPGPNNPLGVRALNWSVPAIRFHGTSNLNQLGQDGSHGCVRLSNRDIVELYDLIEVGAKIVSIR